MRDRLLKDIANGTLTIHTADRTYCFGEDSDVHGGADADADSLKTPKAELTVRNPVFWLRLCAMGDLGFAEAYMYGEIDCDDLAKVFLVRLLPFTRRQGRAHTSRAQVFLANRAELSTLDNSLFSRVMARMPQVGLGSYIVNTVANARKNISAHYDISNNMFMGEPSATICVRFPRSPRSVPNTKASSRKT